MSSLEYSRSCDLLVREAYAIRDVATGQALEGPVPSCPGWTGARLVKHVGTLYRWADAIVGTRSQTRVNSRDLDLGLPAAEAGLPAWLAAGAEQLAQTLRASDPDQPVWAWGADHRVRFWPRRLLHETAIHRADLELAMARVPVIEAAAAVDGVDEFLENLPSAAGFSPGVSRLKGGGETLHLHSTDAEGEWLIELTPDGFSWSHGHGKGTVAVRGSASDLLLLTYGRLSPEDGRLQCFGDLDLLKRWITDSALG